MNDHKQLMEMSALANVLRESALAELRQASLRRERIEVQLAVLDKTGLATGLDTMLAAQVEERYGLWALNRRIALNRALAQEMAGWLNARDRAQIAFGRADVLAKLAEAP